MSSATEFPGVYFSTPALKGLVQQLTHLAFFGDGLSVVLGVKGVGKTRLSHELVGHFEQAHDVVRVSLDAELELAECVDIFSRSLGVSASQGLSVGEMLAGLRHYVQQLAQDKKLVALIIDDAHFLDDQAIGALVSLLQGRSEANFGLHLILISEPGLDRRIDELQILDVPVYDFEIPSLSPSELASFLEKTLPDHGNLESADVQKLWVSSQGIPGSAISLLDKSNQTDSKGSGFKLPAGVPFGHIAAILVLGVILVWSIFLRGGSEPEASKTEQISSPAVAESTTSKVQKIAEKLEEKTALAGETPQKQELVDDSLNESTVPAEELGGQEDEPEANNFVESMPLVQVEAPKLSEQAVIQSPPETDDQQTVVSYEPPSLEKESAPTTESKPQFKYTKDESFLLAQDPNAYTLQVVAASKKASLAAYMLRQPNRDSLYMYRGTRSGKSWFVVVQGVYKTRNLASNSKDSLPPEQAKAGPWPRKFSSIQVEIENFRLINQQ